MCCYSEDEIIRILEERNDIEYIESLNESLNSFFEQETLSERMLRHCDLVHERLCEPIPEELFFDSECYEFEDVIYSNWCNECSYMSKCDIRISERWNNGGELLSNKK